MEKKSLMPSSLVILAIFLCLQVCCCVHPRTDGLDMEAPAFQNCNFIVLQVKVKKLKVKLRECEAEIQVLKDNLKKLRGKPLSLESRQYADSSSCNETAMDGRPLVDGASLKSQSKDDKKKSVSARKPDVSVRSSALSAEADGGRISGNQEDNSFASFSSFESSAENERKIPTSRGTENYEGLPLERMRTDGKVDTRVPFISDSSSILSNTITNSSDSLVSNITEGVQMPCLREGSSDSCEETEPTEMLQATGSGFLNGIAPGNTSLNTGSFNGGIPQEAHFSDSEDVTYGGGNNETVVDDMQGTSIESCNQESSSSCWSGPRASLGLAESNYGSSFSSNYAFHSLLTGHKGLIIGDGIQTSLQHNSIEREKRTIGNGECDPECSSKAGNQPQLLQRNSKGDNQQKEERQEPFSGSSPKTENQPVPQQNSSDSDQVTEESCEPDAVSSSERNWEHQSTQMQRPLDLPLRQSSSPVSGLLPEFLARHSQDRSILQSLYTDDRGLINVSEAISERPYFGAIGASSCERLGGAFSDVSSGGCTARAGFLGSSFHNESSCSSSTHNTAEPLQSFTGQPHFPWVRNGVSSDGVNKRNCLLPQNDFANRNHSLTGEEDFSRECDSLLNQNFLIGSSNSRFVHGSTSSNFPAGIVPRYLIYGVQSHVLSNGNLALIADQRSRHSNLNLESQSSQFGERAEASFAANGVVLGMLAFIVPSL